MELTLFGYSFIIEKKKKKSEPVQEGPKEKDLFRGQTGVWRDKEFVDVAQD